MGRFRKGDRVSVVTTVRWDQSKDETVFLDLGSGVAVSPDEITMVAPHFDIGDPVSHQSGATGYIRATRERLAWVELDDKTGFATWPASELSLIAPEPVIEHAAARPEAPPAAPDEFEVQPPSAVGAQADESPLPF